MQDVIGTSHDYRQWRLHRGSRGQCSPIESVALWWPQIFIRFTMKFCTISILCIQRYCVLACFCLDIIISVGAYNIYRHDLLLLLIASKLFPGNLSVTKFSCTWSSYSSWSL